MQKRHKIDRQLAMAMADNLKDSLKGWKNCGSHRSQKATFVEMGIQLSGFKRVLANQQKLKVTLERYRNYHFQLPGDVNFTNLPLVSEQDGLPIVIFNHHRHTQHQILYIFGGAFFAAPTKEHWKFLDKLAALTKLTIVVPIYSGVPNGTYVKAYQQLLRTYQMMYQQLPSSKIYVMGDSAGAGLATGLCEELTEKGLPQPGKIVLLSPWVDLDLQNPQVAKYENKDMALSVNGLRFVAQQWAGNTEYSDYHLSPINGDVSQFRNVLIFIGTRELMYPDTMLFSRKLRKAGIPVQTVIGREMFHVYPIYTTPESEQALLKIKNFLYN